jgi:perosamine synthetase
MVVTNNDGIAKKARTLKDLAHNEDKRFLHDAIGFNYRMTNIQAAIGVAQFKKIDKFIKMRRSNAKNYNFYLKKIGGIKLPSEEKWAKNVYWMYSILVEDNFGMSRDDLQKALWKKGIDTRTFFVPVHRQPVFKGEDFTGGEYPVADEISKKGLYLPSSSSLTKNQIKIVCDAIKSIKNVIKN